LRLPVLAAQLETVPQQGHVRIEIGRLAYLDEACQELLQSWIKQREAEGQCVLVDRQRLDVFERDAARFTLVGPSQRWTTSLLRNPKPQ
jgi:hypothetical protein